MSYISELFSSSKVLSQPLTSIASKAPVLVTSAYRANLEFYLKGGFTVKVKNGTKQITFLRNLLASFIYEPGGGSIEDVLVLFELMERCTQKAEKDPEYCHKFGEWLITVHKIVAAWKIHSFPFHCPHPEEDIKHLQPHLPSRQAYFGWKHNPVKGHSARVILRNQMKPPKINPKRFVGVGYKDKGTRRDPAKDGSPHWKEVAVHRGKINEEASLKHESKSATGVKMVPIEITFAELQDRLDKE